MSSYDKPKVTIDLQEYNDLQEMISKLQSSDVSKVENMYKTIIAELLNSRMDGAAAMDSLKKQGIEFFVSKPMGHHRYTPNDIHAKQN